MVIDRDLRPVWRDWPVAETVAVFVGVLGIDLLISGHAEPIKAVALAAAYGIGITAARRLLGTRGKKSGK